jgi:hypothetical protein
MGISASSRHIRVTSGTLCPAALMLKPFNIDQLVDAIRDRLGADRAVHYVDAEG